MSLVSGDPSYQSLCSLKKRMADTKKHRSAVECTYRPTNLRRWGQWNKHRSTGATHQVFSRTGKSKLISDILFLCVFIWLSAWQRDRSLHRVPLTNWCSEKLYTSSYNRTVTPGENQEKIIIYIYMNVFVYIYFSIWETMTEKSCTAP